MPAPVLPVAVVLLPAVVGAVLVLLARRVDRLGPAGSRSRASVVGVVAAAVVTVLAAGAAADPVRVGTPFVLGSDLGLDPAGPAQALLPTLAVATLVVLLAASAWGTTAGARFVGLLLLFEASAALTVLATSLPALLVGWELMGAASLALVGYAWREPRPVASGLTAFLTTRAADLGLYVAAGAALAGGAGLALDDLAAAPSGWRDVLAAGVLVAALGKAAQLPFSFWLSRAMDAPSPVSALLHSAAMVALGGYLLLRLAPLLAATGWAADAAAWAGVLTAVLLGAVALAQRDLKQVLAASTAAQLGFVVLAAGVGATAGGTAHLVTHAAVKASLFLLAGAWLGAYGTRRLAPLTGVGRRDRRAGALGAAALLALAGLAPLSLWVTKDVVLAAAAERSAALYAAGLLATVLSAAYAARALVLLLAPPAGTEAGWDEEGEGSREVPRRVLVAVAAPVAAAALAGVPLLALGDGGDTRPGALELVTSAVLALGTALAVGALTGRDLRPARPGRAVWEPPGATVLRGWLGLEPAAHRLLVRPCLVLARAAAQVDDRVLDPAVTVAATGTRGLARAVTRADLGGLDAVVRGVAVGARDLGRRARWPSSTGLLHHYYLQAVAAIGVVLLVLLLAR